MSEVVLHLAQTVDGYISRLDGTVDYLTDMGEGMMKRFLEFVNGIDVVVMGRTTYDEYKQYGFDLYKNQKIYVWTTRPHEPVDNIIFYTNSIKDLLEEVGDKTVWCFGGTKVIKEFLKDDLVDTFEIATVPYILGEGKNMFDPGDYELLLKHKETKVFEGLVITKYVREKKYD